ncbi:Potassium transporter 7 [Abeliophyllum distichum]|uniref:Potassium transporter 7 n=1 Tax=Abeliophyllum distichum TaxID=126358 RepID=A0ABD1THA4_9LAMI
MIIFVCIKYVPVPVVLQSERFLFRRVCPKGYHMFRCVARYGYKDVRKENHQTFEQLLIESLDKFIRREAQERSLESNSDEDSDSEEENSFSRVLIAPNGSVYSLGVPLLAEFEDTKMSISEASTSEEVKAEPHTDPSFLDAEQSLDKGTVLRARNPPTISVWNPSPAHSRGANRRRIFLEPIADAPRVRWNHYSYCSLLSLSSSLSSISPQLKTTIYVKTPSTYRRPTAEPPPPHQTPSTCRRPTV